MAINVNVVPKPLIPIFTSGQIIKLWNFQDEFGSGLALFNALRRAYPNNQNPPLPNDYYVSLISWLQSFLSATKSAANYLNSDPVSVDESVLPKNFYVKRPEDSNCGFQIRGSFGYVGSQSQAFGTLVQHKWFSDISDLGAIRNVFQEDALAALNNMSGSNKKKQTYDLVSNSFRFEGAVRLC